MRPELTLEGDEAVVITDAEEAHELATRAFYPHRLHLLDRQDGERLEVRLKSCRLNENVTIGVIGYGAPVRIDCGQLETGFMVNVPLIGRADYRRSSGQVRANPGLGAVFPPDEQTAIEWVSPDCVQLGVSISSTFMHDTAERLCRKPVRIPRYAHSYDLGDGARRAWVTHVMGVLELMTQLPEVGRAAMTGQLAHAVTAGLLLGADHDLREQLDGDATILPSKVLRRATTAIRDAPSEPVDLLRLASLCGVSVRTLQYEFARHMAMTPSEYRRRIAMAGAHRDLIAAAPAQDTVTSIAARWGFFHQGRFARNYRRRYGVPPATTLRS